MLYKKILNFKAIKTDEKTLEKVIKVTKNRTDKFCTYFVHKISDYLYRIQLFLGRKTSQ